MKLKYLGTAGSEGVPSMFCDCENCSAARALGGRNIRTRSQAIIDERILIDFPCDTFHHILKNNINIKRVEACLITHIHPDHLYPMDMRPDKHYGKAFKIFGSADVRDSLSEIPEHYHKYLDFNEIKPFEPFCVDEYTVTALKANHRTDNPYIYSLSNGKVSILYAHDSGPFPEETWEYLENLGVCFNLISLDCHWGDDKDKTQGGHGCLGVAQKMRERLICSNLANNSTIFVLNHFSHKGKNSVYDKFCVFAQKAGFTVAYDSMEVIL